MDGRLGCNEERGAEREAEREAELGMDRLM